MSYKVVINCSNLKKGGALQVAVSFLRMLLNVEPFEMVLLVSSELDEQLAHFPSISKPAKYLIFENSPSRSKCSRKILLDIVKSEKPKIFFTLFGPHYLRGLKNAHDEMAIVTGFADGWVTHASLRDYFAVYKFDCIKLVKHLLTSTYKRLALRNDDFLIFETEQARRGYRRNLISRFIGSKTKKTEVISNTVRDDFRKLGHELSFDTNSEVERSDIILGVLTADYPHKNIPILMDVALELVKRFQFTAFKFRISIDINSPSAARMRRSEAFKRVGSFFDFSGPISVKESSRFVKESNIIVQVSLLETFSATYLEAQACGVPLIASDRQFARTVAGDGALYVNPQSSFEIAKAIALIAENDKESKRLVLSGYRNVNAFASELERVHSYVELLKNV